MGTYKIISRKQTKRNNLQHQQQQKSIHTEDPRKIIYIVTLSS